MPRHYTLTTSDPEQESKIVMDSISRAGIGGIFAFPFSLKSKAGVESFEGENGSFRYRFHKPFVVNEDEPRVYPNVPVEKWPNFQWSSEVPEIETKKPPATTIVHNDGGNENKLEEYDGLRIDVFGDINKVVKELERVSESFLEWLRCYSAQPWINSYEYHFESKLRHQFFVDENGHCVENPCARGVFVNNYFEAIDNNIYMMAAEKAMSGIDVPQYITVFIDAQNSFARDNYWECALYLSLCIDMARQTLFLNKFRYLVRNNIIIFNNRGLANTDLLKVLDKVLSKECNRSLKTEQPEVWSSFKDLFLTRHQLAHGKNKANVNEQIVDLTQDLVESWTKTAVHVMMFIEDVCDAPFRFSTST